MDITLMLAPNGCSFRGKAIVGTMLPIRTDRLTVRMMRTPDLPVFVAYRNDPEVAALQAWELPYSAERAASALAAQDALDRPLVGQWSQLAIEHDGATVGDLALYLHDDGARAEIGFTLATRHQGKGYAREAAAALVDALFEHTDVHRVEASLDPSNIASMRVLEAIGMQYECIARGAFEWRGEWVDDLRYSMLASERKAWRERDLSPARDVRLVALHGDNVDTYMALTTHWSQQKFVRPVAASLGQASVPITVPGGPLTAESFGIEADGVPVGFLQLADRSLTHDEPYLWRLLIDRWHQRRGIGTRVLELVVERTKAAGHRTLTVSYGEYPGTPRPVYLRFGFVPTGEIVDNEAVARLTW